MSEVSAVDSQEDLAYEEKIRNLKKRIMESKERKRKKDKRTREKLQNFQNSEESNQIRKNRKTQKNKRQFESSNEEENSKFNTKYEDSNSEEENKFNPNDLRLSRFPKDVYSQKFSKSKKTKINYEDKNNDFSSEDNEFQKRNRKSKIRNQNRKRNNNNEEIEKIRDTPRHRTGKPPQSHYTNSETSNTHKKNTSYNPKPSFGNISHYKKNMIFSARLKLKKIKFGNRKSGVLKFDIEYNNNFIPAKKNHEIKGYEKYLKESFEVPFRAIYDRRKRQFSCEKIVVNVMNMHKRYNKRLGQVIVNVSNILNRQLTYFNGKIKLSKTNDRHAEMDILLSLKFKGTVEKEQIQKKEEVYHFDDSYFSSASDK